MQEFFIYFFGEGIEPEFSLFSFAHILPILMLFLALFLLYKYKDRIRSSKYETNFRYILGFMLIICDMSYYWRLSAAPWLSNGAIEHLPIGVCAWSVIFCSFMIIGKSQRLFDISYFWLLCGSVFALLTPTPLTYCGPTRFRYYQFWLEHTLGYIAIFYMIFVHGMRPNKRSFLRSYTALIGLAIFAAWVNSLIPGANYLYMARPESAPSILDILPPHYGLRILIIAVAITILFCLAYLPWHLKDKKAQHI
ncbi:MAG: TIGR02206 family membrane protein [Erysipelotrichaceae bacterium]|nr:TIGR02206 family membrane protein [Erysipelotrichaceae bacterium]